MGLHRTNAAFWLYLVIAGLVVASGLITRLVNQPINAQVMTWTATSLPTEWSILDHRLENSRHGNAQEARDRLFELLDKIPGKESFLAIQDIARIYEDAPNAT